MSQRRPFKCNTAWYPSQGSQISRFKGIGGRGRGGAGVRTRGLGQGRARFGRPRRLAALVPRPGLRPGWKAEEQAVMGLRAAVFDLDGVLALPSLASSWDRAEEELALPR